jgi:hypothetical protein
LLILDSKCLCSSKHLFVPPKPPVTAYIHWSITHLQISQWSCIYLWNTFPERVV